MEKGYAVFAVHAPPFTADNTQLKVDMVNQAQRQKRFSRADSHCELIPVSAIKAFWVTSLLVLNYTNQAKLSMKKNSISNCSLPLLGSFGQQLCDYEASVKWHGNMACCRRKVLYLIYFLIPCVGKHHSCAIAVGWVCRNKAIRNMNEEVTNIP